MKWGIIIVVWDTVWCRFKIIDHYKGYLFFSLHVGLFSQLSYLQRSLVQILEPHQEIQDASRQIHQCHHWQHGSGKNKNTSICNEFKGISEYIALQMLKIEIDKPLSLQWKWSAEISQWQDICFKNLKWYEQGLEKALSIYEIMLNNEQYVY
jgi:hypothetical protein